FADVRGVPAQNFLKHGDEHTHGVVAEHGALRDTRDELGFGDGDGEAVVLIDMHHHRNIGTAIAHVDDVVVADTEFGAALFKNGDFAPSCGSANDRFDFARGFVIAEARAENILRRHNSFERGLDNLLRSRGDHIEMEFVAFRKIGQRARKKSDVVLQSDALAGFYQVIAANAAEFRVVQNQIAEFRTLLDEVHLRKTLDLVVEPVKADEL